MLRSVAPASPHAEDSCGGGAGSAVSPQKSGALQPSAGSHFGPFASAFQKKHHSVLLLPLLLIFPARLTRPLIKSCFYVFLITYSIGRKCILICLGGISTNFRL